MDEFEESTLQLIKDNYESFLNGYIETVYFDDGFHFEDFKELIRDAYIDILPQDMNVDDATMDFVVETAFKLFFIYCGEKNDTQRFQMCEEANELCRDYVKHLGMKKICAIIDNCVDAEGNHSDELLDKFFHDALDSELHKLKYYRDKHWPYCRVAINETVAEVSQNLIDGLNGIE